MLLETWWDMFEVGLLWTLEHLWCQLGRQRQAGSLFRTFAGCQRRRWMERLWLGVDFYVETNKQQCRSSVEVWSVYESMWMNVNHEAHTRCATFINYQYIMKMWCHMISHHKMSQDAWGDLRILKIWRMLISIFETKVSSRNRDTLCGPCCEVRPCPANYLNRVLLWRRLHRDNAPIPLMTALRPCVVTNWAPNASWHVLNVVDISWSLLI